MIASIRGTLIARTADSVVIETGGVGWLVYVPRPLVATLGTIGDEALLYTMMIVREDSMTLYGFTAFDQRALFETLLIVSGIGPKVALGMLSAASPDDLRRAIARRDIAWLSRLPGIGKKTAERLTVELSSKIDASVLPASATADISPATMGLNQQLVDLLTSLGYSAAEAQAAVHSIPPDSPPDLEDRLRIALRYFSGL